MATLVVSGATLKCSFGAATAPLGVLPLNKVTATTPAANTVDSLPVKNVPPFGMCRSLSNPMVAAATAAALGTLTPHLAKAELARRLVEHRAEPRKAVGQRSVIIEDHKGEGGHRGDRSWSSLIGARQLGPGALPQGHAGVNAGGPPPSSTCCEGRSVLHSLHPADGTSAGLARS